MGDEKVGPGVGTIAWTDLTLNIDWEDESRASVPLGLRFGKVLKAKSMLWNINIQPYYQVETGGHDDSWGVKFSATAVMPKWLRH